MNKKSCKESKFKRQEEHIKVLTEKVQMYRDQAYSLQSKVMNHKKAIKTRDIVIQELKENLAGQAQVDIMLRAYIIAMVQDNGGEFRVDKSRISELIQKLPPIKTIPTEDQYILTLEDGDVDAENASEDMC